MAKTFARKLAELLDSNGDINITGVDSSGPVDFDSVQSSNTYISDTVPTYSVKIGDTWFDPTDEILSIATEVDSNIVWIGV